MNRSFSNPNSHAYSNPNLILTLTPNPNSNNNPNYTQPLTLNTMQPKWSNARSLQISATSVALHLIFYYLLMNYGWIVSSVVSGALFYYYYRTGWPGSDERSTYITSWTNTVFWSNLYVYFTTLRDGPTQLQPNPNLTAFLELEPSSDYIHHRNSNSNNRANSIPDESPNLTLSLI